jgi:hypothetical protein
VTVKQWRKGENVSYITFHSRAAVVRLTGSQVSAVFSLAQFSLEARLSRARHCHLRDEFGLPDASSPFFESQLLWLMTDGQAHRAGGQDVYLMDLALQVMYEQSRKYGILCWLFDNALTHGWAAGTDRAAMAAEIESVLDGGPPVLDRDDWGAVITFLRDGTGDVVTSLSQGEEFPNWRLARASGTWCPALRESAEPQDELDALWDQLDDATRWDLGMTALKTRPERQWHPGRYRFSDLTLGNVPGGPAGLVPVAQTTGNL